ncbi:MAG: GGDEF domain-containing protein [Bacteroidetes bacterium SW_9_63_38]|nr:MAG: GGDEF domain-containing protein [Bacteroidetes bacterium SW_9_63_38]
MTRVLIAIVAVLVAVLAFIFDQPWLYGAAAVLLVGTLGYLAYHLWWAYRAPGVAGAGGRAGSDTSDDNFGIMYVRPQEDAEADDGADGDGATPDAADEMEATVDTDATVEVDERIETESAADEASGEAGDEEHPDEDWPEGGMSGEDMDMAGGSTLPAHSHERPVLGPYLESLRAALGAQSAGLLIQEEVVLEYRVEALASVQPNVQHTGTFETQEPLLTATMSRQPVTVRSLNEIGREDLRYYGTVPAIAQVALAPVSRPNSSDTVFLLADATAEVDLGASQARSLLEQFADTIGLLLDIDDLRREQAPEGAVEPDAPASAADGAPVDAPANDSADEDEPRPRSEIVAEEMEAADSAADDLALVLVHLNRAESIARKGEEVVASAERHLHSRLNDLAPGQRVERFGELTYGIFVRSGVNDVEEWAAHLQDTMAQEAGELEGGVSVGVAVRAAHHDPEGLRSDATDALLEAYETGTCTIIA